MTRNTILIRRDETRTRIQPLSWLPSLVILFVLYSLYYIAYHELIPAFIGFSGQPYLVGYFCVWVTTMFAVLFISLGLYTHEGHPLTWKAFAYRYRLDRMPGKDWLWTLAVLLIAAGSYFGLSISARWLASLPIFAPPPLAPIELRPDAAGNFVPGLFFGMPIKHQWWAVGVYFVGWVFNILGEELFYRGWMLPKQELAFRKYAWLVNGTMFTFQHWMQPFNFLAIWPGALFMAWVVQRQRNTWIGILQHGLMNFSLFLILIQGVIAG